MTWHVQPDPTSQVSRESLKGPECQAVLAALASVLSLDISQIEARHSSNRETSMMRAKGWFPSLLGVTAAFVNKTWSAVATMFSRFPKSSGDYDDADHGETGVTNKDVLKQHTKKKQTRARAPRKRRGGGGAWRAFVHHKMSGVARLDGQTMSALAVEYRSLSPSEKTVFVEAGKAAARAHRAGFDAFSTARRAKPTPTCRPSRPQIGDLTDSGAVVAADPTSLLEESLQYHGVFTFVSRYDLVKQQIKDLCADFSAQQAQQGLSELQAPLSGLSSLSRAEEDQLHQFHAQAAADPLVTSMCKEHEDLAVGFSKTDGADHQPFIAFHWVAPIYVFLQALLRLRPRDHQNH